MTTQRSQEAYTASFVEKFSSLKDPRRTSKGNIIYPLNEILFLVVTAVLCGHSDYICIEDFGEQHIDWLKKYFPYTNGTCSHDVIGKLFQKIDYNCFNVCFMAWASATYQLTEAELISIDGKRIRGSYDTNHSKLASHIVTAYMSSQNIAIGQKAVSNKSNEITAIPDLLDSIEIKGAIISIDAMGCQKAIAEKIVAKGADYLLAVKDNQQDLHDQLKRLFTLNLHFNNSVTETFDHGRVEKRTATILTDLSMMSQREEWTNLNCAIKIESERYDKLSKQTTKEQRHYICSTTKYGAEKINELVRSHWAIENKLHWHLDVNFGEDNARKRIGNSEKNFNIILKTALAILLRDKTKNFSIKRKKQKASYDVKYREFLMKV